MKGKVLILTFLLIVINLFNMPVWALSTTLQINLGDLLSQNDLRKLGSTHLEDIVISKIEEDNDHYFFLLHDQTLRYNIAVLKLRKYDLHKVNLLSIYQEEALKNTFIKEMKVDPNGNLWLTLEGDQESKTCRIDPHGQITEVTYPTRTRVRLEASSVLFQGYDDPILKRWNGQRIQSYPLTTDELLDFAEHDGQIYTLDIDGNLYWVNEDGNNTVIANIASLLNLREDYSLETGSIVSVGGKLWASAGIIKYPEMELVPVGLINLSDQTILTQEVLGGRIYKVIEQANGDLYFLLQSFFPIVPHLPPDGERMEEIYLSKDADIKIRPVKGYWEDIEEHYIDQLCNLWAYNLRGEQRGVVMTTPDQTTVHFTFSPSLKKEDISVVHQGRKINFDVAPYIQNERTMVPLRGIAYLLKATTHWNGETQTVVIEKDGMEIQLPIGKPYAIVNGNTVPIEAPAEIKENRTMVPLRFLAETLSIEIKWDENSRTIFLQSN